MPARYDDQIISTRDSIANVVVAGPRAHNMKKMILRHVAVGRDAH
jgi:hypothetical protein